MWEDVQGQKSFPVSAGFELITLGLSVQEHNYSITHTHAHTHTHTHAHTHACTHIHDERKHFDNLACKKSEFGRGKYGMKRKKKKMENSDSV